MSTTHPMADSRDMFVVHDMFRKQLAAIPDLVSEVGDGDSDQVAIVADHVTRMVTFLHAHYEREDRLARPRLLDRVPARTDPLSYTMKAQHHALAKALDSLGANAVAWRSTCAVREREALAGAARALLGRVIEHLDLEEREVLPLIGKYLTEQEWAEVGGSGLKMMSFDRITVDSGMIFDHVPPEAVKITRDTLPRIPWTIFSFVGARAYVSYAACLHTADNSARPMAA